MKTSEQMCNQIKRLIILTLTYIFGNGENCILKGNGQKRCNEVVVANTKQCRVRRHRG
jgi:hypothetical protein